MTKLLHVLRTQYLGALALFVALGGTGYAAVSLPSGSVGTAQLRNRSVTPAKLAGRQIGGTIFAWAYVDASGKVLAAHGLRPALVHGTNGEYTFGLQNEHVGLRCAAMASVAATDVQGNIPGYATALLSLVPKPAGVVVQTFDAQGQSSRLPFVTEVLC